MSELLVLRHAAADDGPSDHERPLARRGRQDAVLMGRWLMRQQLLPDRVLCSTAIRARETARLLLEAFSEQGPTPPEVLLDERLYLASPHSLAGVLRERAKAAQRLLLVAHNPGLPRLVAALIGTPLPGDPPGGAPFPTASLAWLRLDGPLEQLLPGRARCLELIRVSELRAEDPL